MSLTDKDREWVKNMIELGLRQYFDRYLLDVFPTQMKEIMDSHDKNADAHGGIRSKHSRMKNVLVGFAMGAAFAGGAGLDAMIRFLGAG